MTANHNRPSYIDSLISVKSILILLLVFVILASGSYLVGRYGSGRIRVRSKKSNNSPSTPLSSPYPLAQGKQTYTLSHGKNVNGPLPLQVIIDPYDPTVNTSQTISMHITHTEPVRTANIVLESDHTKTPPQALHRVSGTDTDGIWETTYTITDTHDHVYNLWIDLQSATSSFYNKLTFRAY